MNKETEKAYLAGMMDADGHFSWRGGRYNSPDIGVANTDIKLMNWLKNNFGGSFNFEPICKINCPKKENNKNHICRKQIMYRWHAVGERAAIIIRIILPYLKIKTERAEEVLSESEKSYKKLKRPKRRDFHIKKETKLMKELGWI